MPGLPPKKTALSEPFWDGLAKSQIVMQSCDSCSRTIFYPRPSCPYCGSRELTWKPRDDAITLFTYSIAEDPVSPVFADVDRMIIAVADLDGAHIPSTLVDIAPDDVKIGMRLEPVFDSQSYEGITILRFRPGA